MHALSACAVAASAGIVMARFADEYGVALAVLSADFLYAAIVSGFIAAVACAAGAADTDNGDNGETMETHWWDGSCLALVFACAYARQHVGLPLSIMCSYACTYLLFRVATSGWAQLQREDSPDVSGWVAAVSSFVACCWIHAQLFLGFAFVLATAHAHLGGVLSAKAKAARVCAFAAFACFERIAGKLLSIGFVVLVLCVRRTQSTWLTVAKLYRS